MRGLAVLAVAAAALGACSQQGEDKKAVTGNAEAASELMSPRAGLWEQTVGAPGAPQAMTMRICVGPPEADDNPFNPAPGENGDCSKPNVRRVGGALEFETQCASDGTTIATKGKVTGDLRSAYQVEMVMSMSGAALPPGMPAENAMTVSARRLGDCPAGVEPGSILP